MAFTIGTNRGALLEQQTSFGTMAQVVYFTV